MGKRGERAVDIVEGGQEKHIESLRVELSNKSWLLSFRSG